jgi:hypothetical protein
MPLAREDWCKRVELKSERDADIIDVEFLYIDFVKPQLFLDLEHNVDLKMITGCFCGRFDTKKNLMIQF